MPTANSLVQTIVEQREQFPNSLVNLGVTTSTNMARVFPDYVRRSGFVVKIYGVALEGFRSVEVRQTQSPFDQNLYVKRGNLHTSFISSAEMGPYPR